ncbi:MAG: HEPN domain-containing protein [Candidatus Omnitrophica bacterium]|nr:HEPN domain-containing protein [Candidatus Omnitrophota bacterium]
MTFDNFIKEYSKKGLLKNQTVDFKSIENHIARALKELNAAQANIAIDEGIAYTIAYTALLHAGRALMFFKGYRPTDGYQHKTVVEFCIIVLGDKYKELTAHFDRMRRKRNIFTYEVNISISPTEVKNSLKTANEFVNLIKETITKTSPQHKFKF